MPAVNRSPVVYTPSTVSELLELRTRMPQATIWAGGTALMSRYYFYPYPLSRDIISLGKVAELSRITRTERYLDIGSTATIEQILTVGHHILPPLLARALRQIGPPTLTSRATIGGNLCIPDLRLNLSASLSLFQVQVELRGGKRFGQQSRWIPLNRLYQKEGGLLIQDHEVLTRIRITFDEGDFQQFQQIGFPYRYPEEAVLFSLFARHSQSSVSDYRLAFTFPRIGIFRDRDIESAVTNQSLPLMHGDIAEISDLLRRSLHHFSSRIAPIQYARSIRAFERSLTLLNTRSVSR